MFKRVVFTGLLAAALAWPATGQEKPKKHLTGEYTSTMTATVEAIDTARREVTLKGPGGQLVVMEVPESVKRFPEIKVGDHFTVKYTEALVIDVHKADSAAKLGMTEETNTEHKPGVKPSGVLTRRITATVAVEAVDRKAPSITVREANGNTSSYRVQDVKNLESVKPGDKLVITYNEAVAMSVTEPPAK